MRVIKSSELPDSIREHIMEASGAYLLGTTAVDVQSVTQQPRIETHFYHLPPPECPRAVETMLALYPGLADPYVLSPEYAAFVSGYLIHLVWDEVWAWKVFIPFYYSSGLWTDRRTRSVHHNALRVLLDRDAERELRKGTTLTALLREVAPDHWLPFVEEGALQYWRDWVVTQLADPQAVQTVQVFAERMGVTVAHLEAVAQAISAGTYDPPVPGLEEAIIQFESQALAESLSYLLWYWRFKERLEIGPCVAGISKY
ncbi:MAG: hypothetical protein JXA33_22385 [Anaerolineae bacterium]|nr:hypothetical protein [Anaerolineae bacterium]